METPPTHAAPLHTDEWSLSDRLEQTLGRRPVALRPTVGGCTIARRVIAHFADSSTAFVKAAVDPQTAGWLRTEGAVYTTLDSQPFLPRLLAYDPGDDGANSLPLLILEDVSRGFAPPPWTTAAIDAVLEALDAIRSCAAFAPPALPRLADDRDIFGKWRRIADDPAPFLSLGIASEAWLNAALPTLIAAAGSVDLSGSDLCHVDVRSDNLRIVDGRAVLFDWNWASIGDGRLDLAGWLPSLASEGGPLPETILPDSGPLAALVCGHWAHAAGQPPIPNAPYVRPLQKRQLEFALPWTIRALGLGDRG